MQPLGLLNPCAKRNEPLNSTTAALKQTGAIAGPCLFHNPLPLPPWQETGRQANQPQKGQDPPRSQFDQGLVISLQIPYSTFWDFISWTDFPKVPGSFYGLKLQTLISHRNLLSLWWSHYVCLSTGFRKRSHFVNIKNVRTLTAVLVYDMKNYYWTRETCFCLALLYNRIYMTEYEYMLHTAVIKYYKCLSFKGSYTILSMQI